MLKQLLAVLLLLLYISKIVQIFSNYNIHSNIILTPYNKQVNNGNLNFHHLALPFLQKNAQHIRRRPVIHSEV